MRLHVILAVLKRNVASYFTGVLGYLFITAFVVLAVALAMDTRFFAENDCSLDRLSTNFHWLLLFIVPAITMTAWADERKQGTDELLFTLPAKDSEILAGKYGAVLGVYTISLMFTGSLILGLEYLGSPDYGMLLTTYVGYWLAGSAMLAVGMFASSLTNSSTVAFVLAALMASLFVFVDELRGIRSSLESLGVREPLGVSGYLAEFSSGIIPLGGAIYFIAITAVFLYLNAVMIARRHWKGSPTATGNGIEYTIRAICLTTVAVCLSYAFSVIGSRLDLTRGSQFSLSPVSRDVINKIDAKRPVMLTAYLSEEVPKEFLPVRKKLQGILKEFDKMGGSQVDVRLVTVQPLSKEAEEASQWGIQPRQAQTEKDGRFSLEEVFLGVVASSGFDQVVVPYFEKGTPVEYEITRAIGTVSKAKKLTVGILTTDAKVFGGMNMQTFQPNPEWRLVTDLKQQYKVVEVSPDKPIPVKGAKPPETPKSGEQPDPAAEEAPPADPVDVLVAVLPSSLTQEQMKHLVDYVKTGAPCLIFDDPVPVFTGLDNSPNMPNKPGQGGGMFGMGGAPGAPKADGGKASSLIEAIGIDWDPNDVVFDEHNPHPALEEQLPYKQLLYVQSATDASKSGINTQEPITAGLQEVLAFFAGTIQKASGAKVEFTPLLKTAADNTGLQGWSDATESSMFGQPQVKLDGPRIPDKESHVLAARVKGTETNGVNVIYVADTDLVHSIMYDVAERQLLNLEIDNSLFVMNCVDALAGEEGYVRLRNRRPVKTPLAKVDEQKQEFDKIRKSREQEANKAADKSLADAKAALDKVLEEIKNNKELDEVTKITILETRTAAENRRLELTQKEIDRAKASAIRTARIESNNKEKAIENGVWMRLMLLCPLPAILMGMVVLIYRVLNEDSGISSDRLVSR